MNILKGKKDMGDKGMENIESSINTRWQQMKTITVILLNS